MSNLGFGLSSFLLERYYPYPKTLPAGLTEVEKAAYYADAYYIWYYFLAIGITAAFAIFIFKVVTERNKKKNGVEAL